jgi:hypothetical protein
MKRKQRNENPICTVPQQSLSCFLQARDVLALYLTSKEHNCHFARHWGLKHIHVVKDDRASFGSDVRQIRVPFFVAVQMTMEQQKQIEVCICSQCYCCSKTMLPNLREFHVAYGDILKEPLPDLRCFNGPHVSVADAKYLPCSLRELKIFDIRQGSLDHCTQLQTLCLQHVGVLEESTLLFSTVAASLTSLKVENLDCVSIVTLASTLLELIVTDTIAHMDQLSVFSSLRKLDVSQCSNDAKFNGKLLPCNLTFLRAGFLQDISVLPAKLEVLKVMNCFSLIKDQLPLSLKKLYFSGIFQNCNALQRLTNLAKIHWRPRRLWETGAVWGFQVQLSSGQTVYIKMRSYMHKVLPDIDFLFEKPLDQSDIHISVVHLLNVSQRMVVHLHPMQDSLLQLHLRRTDVENQHPLPVFKNLQLFELSPDGSDPPVRPFCVHFFAGCPQITTIIDNTKMFHLLFENVALPLLLAHFSFADESNVEKTVCALPILKTLSVPLYNRQKAEMSRSCFQLVTLQHRYITLHYM